MATKYKGVSLIFDLKSIDILIFPQKLGEVKGKRTEMR